MSDAKSQGARAARNRRLARIKQLRELKELVDQIIEYADVPDNHFMVPIDIGHLVEKVLLFNAKFGDVKNIRGAVDLALRLERNRDSSF